MLWKGKSLSGMRLLWIYMCTVHAQTSSKIGKRSFLPAVTVMIFMCQGLGLFMKEHGIHKEQQ